MNIKKIIVFCTFLFSISTSISAQNYSHEFGVITDYEKNMTQYENDTTAEAIIIFDSGESAFYKNINKFDLYFKRHTKIKILKESYINNTNYNIPFYKGNRGNIELINFKAYTYNIKNDQLIQTKLNKTQIFKETINKYWDNLKFAMPNVQVGSIIEFEYEISSPYKFLLHDWEFQSSIPTIFSEYTVKMVPFFEYRTRLQGSNKFDEKKISEDKIGLENEFLGIEYRDMIYYIM